MKALTPLQFLSRFTQEEQAAVILSTDPEIQIFRFLFGIADRIVSTDPRLAVGKQLLVTKGLLTLARANAIFSFKSAKELAEEAQNP